MFRVPFISCLTVVSIAACSARHPVDDHASSAAVLPDVNVPAPSATGEPHGPTMPATREPAPATRIPAAFQGRWGLAPRDCTSPRAAARGLLVITSDDLAFHESHAVPGADVQADRDSIGGNFAFTGEGQSWTKYEALKVDRYKLTRTETHPMASFSYAKCS
jgi:hypothetical protein